VIRTSVAALALDAFSFATRADQPFPRPAFRCLAHCKNVSRVSSFMGKKHSMRSS
jgi:hypothetical protein